MNPYVPILVIGAIGFGFAGFSVLAGALTGPKRYNKSKADAYECGIEPSPQAAEGGKEVSTQLDATNSSIVALDP